MAAKNSALCFIGSETWNPWPNWIWSLNFTSYCSYCRKIHTLSCFLESCVMSWPIRNGFKTANWLEEWSKSIRCSFYLIVCINFLSSIIQFFSLVAFSNVYYNSGDFVFKKFRIFAKALNFFEPNKNFSAFRTIST